MCLKSSASPSRVGGVNQAYAGCAALLPLIVFAGIGVYLLAHARSSPSEEAIEVVKVVLPYVQALFWPGVALVAIAVAGPVMCETLARILEVAISKNSLAVKFSENFSSQKNVLDTMTAEAHDTVPQPGEED